MKPWLLKAHRWIALVFSLPLVTVLGTGLVLSVEPWLVVQAIKPGTLTTEKVHALLDKYDPSGSASGISYRSYDNTLTIGGRGSGMVIDAATGAPTAPSTAAALLGTMRRTHERFIFDQRWVVIASSFAMLGLALLGLLMGWPRIRNTFAGWHKTMAWGGLPLIVLSPLTGALLGYNVTFTGSASSGRVQGPPLNLKEAVEIAGKSHDLSALLWIRPRGGRMAMRIVENSEYRNYAITRAGMEPMTRNWPRLWHEGNFAGMWSSLMNLVISVAMLGLLITGGWIWLRRKLRAQVKRKYENANEWAAAAIKPR
ncbi:MAG TPA: PepSY-associated TM helix domain-containing protein [Pseudolabrys sp.]|jgi:uncharacterized iron-regulated membrane protein